MDGIAVLVGILHILIPLAAVPRLIYCLICMAMDEDQAVTYKRRARNAVIFVAVSQCIAALILTIQRYY